MTAFDDSRLEDPGTLAAADNVLRPLAEAGARLRREVERALEPLGAMDGDDRPRAVIAVGPEARLLRAVLEPVCPVPFVAWPNIGLPAWVGPLDVVVVLGGEPRRAAACATEALRRGRRLVVTASEDSPVARQATARATTLLPVSTADPLVAAIAALMGLHRLGLAPEVDPDAIAAAMDAVARDCSFALDATQNPAKRLALELADSEPLIWGGSVLAARAARRIAESLRTASGRLALAADADDLLPLLADAPRRDPFADPFSEGDVRRPSLVVVEDGQGDPGTDEQRESLEANARFGDVRTSVLEHAQGSVMERYVTVLQKGLFAAAYLRIGLDRVR